MPTLEHELREMRNEDTLNKIATDITNMQIDIAEIKTQLTKKESTLRKLWQTLKDLHTTYFSR